MSNDTISRQAVLGELKDLYIKNPTCNSDYGWDAAIDTITDKVKDLPSAQQEIIRCKDCKYASPDGKYGCKVYHFKKYETHEMKADDFCSIAERRSNG